MGVHTVNAWWAFVGVHTVNAWWAFVGVHILSMLGGLESVVWTDEFEWRLTNKLISCIIYASP